MSRLKIDRDEWEVVKDDFNNMVKAVNNGLDSDSMRNVFDSYNFARALMDFAKFLGKNKEMFIRTGALMNEIDGEGYENLVKYGLEHPLLLSNDSEESKKEENATCAHEVLNDLLKELRKRNK